VILHHHHLFLMSDFPNARNPNANTQPEKSQYMENLAKWGDSEVPFEDLAADPELIKQFVWNIHELQSLCEYICCSHRGYSSGGKIHSLWSPPLDENMDMEVKLMKLHTLRSHLEKVMKPGSVLEEHLFATDINIRFPLDYGNVQVISLDQKDTNLNFHPSKRTMFDDGKKMPAVPMVPENYTCSITGMSFSPLFLYLFMNLGFFQDGISPCIFSQPQDINFIPDGREGKEVQQKAERERKYWEEQYWADRALPLRATKDLSVFAYRVDIGTQDENAGSQARAPRLLRMVRGVFCPSQDLAGGPMGRRLEESTSVDDLYKFFFGILPEDLEDIEAYPARRTELPVEFGSQEYEMHMLSRFLERISKMYNHFGGIKDWIKFYGSVHGRMCRAGLNIRGFTDITKVESLYGLIHHTAMLLQSITDIRIGFLYGLEETIGKVQALANIRIPVGGREDFNVRASGHPLASPSLDFQLMNLDAEVEFIWVSEKREILDTILGEEEASLLRMHSKNRKEEK
jgi:hypothetical protein